MLLYPLPKWSRAVQRQLSGRSSEPLQSETTEITLTMVLLLLLVSGLVHIPLFRSFVGAAEADLLHLMQQKDIADALQVSARGVRVSSTCIRPEVLLDAIQDRIEAMPMTEVHVKRPRY